MRGRLTLAACAALLAKVVLAGPDCNEDPTICGVKPFEECVECGVTASGAPRHCCVQPPDSPDCYRYPGACGADKWCELNDRKSWNDTDATTMGRCERQYSKLWQRDPIVARSDPPEPASHRCRRHLPVCL